MARTWRSQHTYIGIQSIGENSQSILSSSDVYSINLLYIKMKKGKENEYWKNKNTWPFVMTLHYFKTGITSIWVAHSYFSIFSDFDFYHFIRPWSVDSLDGGFITSHFCPVGRLESKNKNKILLVLIFFLSVKVVVGRSENKKKKCFDSEALSLSLHFRRLICPSL